MLLGLAAFAVLCAFARPAEIGRLLLQENPAWIGASFGLLLLVMVIRAWRWWWLLRDIPCVVHCARIVHVGSSLFLHLEPQPLILFAT